MKIGIGLPAAVPGADMAATGRWAAAAERAGFESLGVIDRLLYDNVEPLTALAAAGACTSRVEQLASVTRLSGGRLTAGLGMGGWPADYEASGVSLAGRGALFERSLADGGWTVDFPSNSPAASLEWRGYATVRAIDILEGQR